MWLMSTFWANTPTMRTPTSLPSSLSIAYVQLPSDVPERIDIDVRTEDRLAVELEVLAHLVLLVRQTHREDRSDDLRVGHVRRQVALPGVAVPRDTRERVRTLHFELDVD